MQKWEHRWEFVFLDQGEYILVHGKKQLMGYRVWDYLSSLGKEGWELVSVAPQIGDINPMTGKSSTGIASLMDMAIAGPRVTTMTQHRAGTVGFFFWYKRPLEIIRCSVCNSEITSDSQFCTKCGSKLIG